MSLFLTEPKHFAKDQLIVYAMLKGSFKAETCVFLCPHSIMSEYISQLQ